MSEPGQPSPTPSPRRRLRAVAIIVVTAAVVAAIVVVVLRDGGGHPRSWDARVEPYAEIVEEQRGLTFDHPVEVRFLDDEAFEKTVRADKEDLDADDREDLEETTSLFRAFGLISGDVDLFDEINDASGSGTLAYYSFDDRNITVRGSKLTLAVRATLVHELTHALQDQHFQVAERLEKLGKKAADGEPTTAGDALQAIVEGDAQRVADLYRASLSDKEQKALQDAEQTDTEDNAAALESVPGIIKTLMGAPYALGQALTQIVAAGDDDAIDELFDDPPGDDSVLIDPLKALDRDDRSTAVDVPEPGSGEKKFDSGQVGDVVTYLMLAQRIPLRDALAAADTWDGDAYLGFKRDGALCARVEYATGSAKDAARLTSALDRWVDAGPDGSDAKVGGEGDRVTFESCDPGKDADIGKDASEDAFTLVATRAYLGAGAIQSGGTADIARCFSGRIIDEYSVKQLTDPQFGANDPAVQKRVQALIASCR